MTQSQFQGCLLGLALGDAFCAPYEGGMIEQLLWRIIGKTKEGKHRFTDDTQMSIDVARSLIVNRGVHQDHLAQSFAKSYRWSRGYGPSASRLLKKVQAGYHWSTVNTVRHPQGSFGNGAAMRSPPIALFYIHQPEHLADAVTDVSIITHAHPLGIEGAQLIAHIVQASLQAKECGYSAIKVAKEGLKGCQNNRFITQMHQVIEWLNRAERRDDRPISVQEVRQILGNGIAATTSCATAVYVGLKYRNSPFLEMLHYVEQISGDTDTIAAMAGAIWGAHRGIAAIDPMMIHSLEMGDTLLTLGAELYRASSDLKDCE